MTSSQNNNEIIEDSGIFSDDKSVGEGIVTPMHMLSFAKRILIAISVIFGIASVMEYFSPHNAIFEACRGALPPLAGVVIGYYFGAPK